MQTPLEVFAANLERLRRERGLQKQELAKRSGLYGSDLSDYLGAKRSPRLEVLRALATALGVSVTELVEPPEPGAAVRNEGALFLNRAEAEEIRQLIQRLAEIVGPA